MMLLDYGYRKMLPNFLFVVVEERANFDENPEKTSQTDDLSS